MVDQGRRITVVLHHERDSLWIGEPFRPRLQVVNERGTPVQLGRGFALNGEELAFSAPNAVHLLGPGGTDLAAPYAGAPAGGGAPIEVEAGGTAWDFLPVHAHLPMDQPGRYELWLELADGDGVVHASNHVPVTLHEAPSNVAPDAASLELAVGGGEAGQPTMRATFHNRSDRELVFLAPQQDSAWGWVNPVYRFTVTDARGRALALAPRSGTMAVPEYGPASRIRVAPGASHTLDLPLSDHPGLRQPGTYRVRLTYLVRDRAIGKSGVVLDRQMEWEPEVFLGRLRSDEVEVTIP